MLLNKATYMVTFMNYAKSCFLVRLRASLFRSFSTTRRIKYFNVPKEKRQQFIKLMRGQPIKSRVSQVLDILPASLDDVLCTIPAGSNSYILYCLNARDFPLSLTKRFFRLMKQRNLKINKTYFIINMLDNITDDLSKTNLERYRSYYVESLRVFLHKLPFNMNFEVDPKHILVMTDKVASPILDLYRQISLESSQFFVIGESNTGKSTLVKRLMRMALRNIPATVNSTISSEVENKESSSRSGIIINNYYTISPYPFSTRKNIEYGVRALDFSLIDTPGFLHHRKGIYGILKKEDRLKLQQQFHFDQSQHSVVLKPNLSSQVFSVNDVFFLKPRGVNSFKYRRFLYGKAALYNKYTDGYEQMINTGKFVKPGVRRYLMPPFKGKIDLVFENIGFIELDNTVEAQSPDVWQLYAPKDVKKILRIPSLSVSIKNCQEPIYIPLREVPMLLNFKKYNEELSKYSISSFKILQPYMECAKIG